MPGSRAGCSSPALSFGALTILTGCDDPTAFRSRILGEISHFNDKVQAALFDPNMLAPTFPESAITKPFPFNAYYGEDETPIVNGADYKLQVSGLVEDKSRGLWPACALPQTSR